MFLQFPHSRLVSGGDFNLPEPSMHNRYILE